MVVTARIAWANYNVALTKRPMLTRALTSGAMIAASDAIAQCIERKGAKGERGGHDFGRTLTLAAFILSVQSPAYYLWNMNLHRMASMWKTTNLMAVAARKLSLEIAVWNPTSLSCMLAFTACTKELRGQPESSNSEGLSANFLFGRVKDRLETDLVQVWSSGAGFWAIAGLVNFRFVPVPYQMLFFSVLGLAYNVYLVNFMAGQP